MKTFLVTGATGTVGRHVVRSLVDRGCRVLAASRFPTSGVRASLQNDVPGVSTVALDFEAPQTYGKAFGGVHALFLVRPPSVTRVWASIFPALDAAASAGVRHVVFLSIQGAESNPLVPHRWIEWKLASMDVVSTVLRPSFFMQNLATTHRSELKQQSRIVVPAGGGRTAFIDARDIAEVAARVLTGRRLAGRAYELTGAEALSYHEVARILTRVLGRPVAYANPSLAAFVRHARAHGRPWPLVLVMSGIYLSVRFGLAARTTSEVAELLGRPPRTFREFAEDYAHVWTPGNRSSVYPDEGTPGP